MTAPKHDRRDLLTRSISGEGLPDPRRSLELLALAQGGDTRALEELISRYSDRIRRIVRIQLGTSELRRHYDSMDIVQSTFKAALPQICDLRPRSAAGLLRWLAIIATNQIRDAHDRIHAGMRDSRRDVPLDAGTSETGASALPSAAGVAPDEEAMLREVRELLDEEVVRLPKDQRRVVLLRDYCGETWERIATELQRDNGATRQLHQRAWIQLRKTLRPKLEGRG